MTFQIVSLELKYLSISFYTSEIFLKVAASKKNVADFFVLHILRFEIFVYAYNSLFCNTTLAASLNVKRNNRKRLTFHLKHFKATFPFTAHSSRVSHPLLQTLSIVYSVKYLCFKRYWWNSKVIYYLGGTSNIILITYFPSLSNNVQLFSEVYSHFENNTHF